MNHYYTTQQKNTIMKTVKINSRLDNNNGYVVTKKEYKCTIVKMLQYNFCIVKINDKLFKTDYSNLI
jgi:hypothetical protein